MQLAKMITAAVCFLMIIIGQPRADDLYPEDWIGLWIGEGQIGDFPDFGTFSLGDDYIRISSCSDAGCHINGQTHWARRNYGSLGAIALLNAPTVHVDDFFSDCTVTLKFVKTESLHTNYLDVSSVCEGFFNTKFDGKYQRFKNSERR